MYGPRGFSCIEEHDAAIIERWNKTVKSEDTVFILGDLMLNDNQHGIDCLKQLNGLKMVFFGNHDTDERKHIYESGEISNLYIGGYANVIKHGKYHFYLSHYPTLTANLEKEHLTQCMINLFGHTHQKTNFYNDMPFMYHVGVDSHDCIPVDIDTIINDCKAKVKECKDML